jgi:magnesium transporter
MLRAFISRDDRLVELQVPGESEALSDAVWIDLVKPTPEEIRSVEDIIGISLPNIQETEEIEATSHYEVYPLGLQVNCSFLLQAEQQYRIANAAFLFSGHCLVSLSAHVIPLLRFFQSRAESGRGMIRDPLSTIIRLQEIKIEKLADMSEEAYLAIEKISRRIFNREDSVLEETINILSRQDDLNGKIRLCLMDGQRDLNFLLRRGRLTDTNLEAANESLEDIRTLLSHNTFLSERIDFLLNAALGFINIEQNKIIKIFSIAAVVFMPPTVVASIYGMNFHHLPELSWAWGYPFSLFLMVISGLTPYLYFKRKGWL